VASEHPYREPPESAPAPSRWRAWLRGDHWPRAILSGWRWYRRLAGGTWVYLHHWPCAQEGWFPSPPAPSRWTYHLLAAEHYPAAESGGPR
jgi:hypothetical protein